MQGARRLVGVGVEVKPRVDFCPDCGAELTPRSDAQNRMLHAMLSEVARTREWAGQRLTVEEWKRLFTAAHCRAQKQHVRLVPAIDGQGFDVLYKRTSRMAKREMADLITYVDWWCAENGAPLQGAA